MACFADVAEKRDFDPERPSSHRNAPDELKEPDLELALDDEFPQTYADGAFSADAMTNDIGRADNEDLVRPNPLLPKFHSIFDPTINERRNIVISTDIINRFDEIL